MNTKWSTVNLGKTYNDCVIEVTLSHKKNPSQNCRKLPRNKTMGWAVSGMWDGQPYHLCYLVNVGLRKLWDIRLQSLLLQHIKANCELHTKAFTGKVRPRTCFSKPLLVLSGTICTHGRCSIVNCQVNLSVQVVWHRWTFKELLRFGNLMEKGYQRQNWDCSPLWKEASSSSMCRRFP